MPKQGPDSKPAAPSKIAEQMHKSVNPRGTTTLHLGPDVKLYPTKQGGYKAESPKPK
jgi:hypothetical protein